MNGNTHTIKRAITGFALAAAVAALVVPSALASGGPFYRVHTGASTTTTDGSAALMERHFKHEDSLYSNTANTPVSQPRGGFDWNDAGTGAGAALGLALVAFAVGTLAARARMDSKMTGDWNIKKRRRLARALERAAVPERPFIGRGPRYLVQPSVTVACAPSLRTIATALRDDTRLLDERGLRAVLSFITEGGSPFFGRDATDALRQAVRLQHIVVGAETAILDQEHAAVAA
jgi:hypothetical protein